MGRGRKPGDGRGRLGGRTKGTPNAETQLNRDMIQAFLDQNAEEAWKAWHEIENPALSLKELWFRYEKDSPDILRGVSAEVPVGRVKPGELINVTTAEGTTFSSLIMTVESRNGRDRIETTGSPDRSTAGVGTELNPGAILGKMTALREELAGIHLFLKQGGFQPIAVDFVVACKFHSILP